MIAAVILSDSASLSRTTATADAIRAEVEKNKDVAFQFAVNGLDFIGGGNKTNVSTMFIRMTEWSQRETTADDLVEQVFAAGAQQTDGMAIAFNPPAIRGLGSTGGFELYVQSRTNSDPQRLAEVVDDFMAALAQEPKIASINAFYRTRVPQFLFMWMKPRLFRKVLLLRISMKHCKVPWGRFM